MNFTIKTTALRIVLDIDVDLKIVTENYTIALRKAILEGDAIYESRDFGSCLYDLQNFKTLYSK